MGIGILHKKLNHGLMSGMLCDTLETHVQNI